MLLVAMTLCSAAYGAKKVHTLGDSTMAPYDESATETRGWGMYFGQFLTGGWKSLNYAKGGRDSRQGYTELWQNAKSNVEAGDYVLIQFAHNDEKINGVDRDDLYNYYIKKGMTKEAAALETRGTTPSTTYKVWLTKIIDEVKAKGATPILVSAVCRCYFSGNKINRAGRHDLGDKFSILTDTGVKDNQKIGADDHTMDYSYHMEQLAKEKNVDFIDMTTATKDLYENYGASKCYATLFDKHETANGGKQDNTHYNTTGALLAARLCAQLLKEKGILADNIVVPTDLTISPATADLGDGYKGQTVVKELTLNGFGLTPANGNISITATDGIELSKDKSTWSNSIDIAYINGTLVQNFYARVILSTAGALKGTITAKQGDKTVDVPLTGNVVELGGGAPFSAIWALKANDDAIVEGNVTALTVKINNMVKYGNNSGKGLMASQADNGSWTKAEDDDPERYISINVRCPEGKTLDINHISMKVGGHGGNGMMCHVYYSTDGFKTRTTIYAPQSMKSGEMNSVEAAPVIKLEEGDELQVRIYPWYSSNATGKWLCISDVNISGQTKDAGGINITGKLIYKLDKGGINQEDDVTYEPADMGAGFIGKKWTAGSDLTLDGTITYQGKNDERTVMTKIYNDTGASFSSAAGASNTMTLTLTPEDGFKFIPSKISFQGARFGTNGGKLTVVAETGSKSEELCANADVNRSGKSLDIASFCFDVSSLMASSAEPLKLNFSFIGLGMTKTMGLANLVIEGTMAGSAIQTTKYTLNTSIEPAEAGSINNEPDLTSYKEGTEVSLTAKKNFGYQFKEWQDASGKSLGTETALTIKMDAEKSVKAVFEAVPVYTVTTRTTNDADRTLGSITLTPNDHNGQYEAGSEITATAVESKVLKFMQWTDKFENAGTTPARTITVNSDMELVANYELQDFIAVFDASANNYYAYLTTSGYPFPADLAWDNERAASCAVVKVKDGSLAYTKDGGTPVVRNRESVVLPSINGLYQNGYNTTDIAFQYQFSTIGFTSARFEADMAAKNMASLNWKALISTDGTNFEPIEGATWEITANTVMPLSIELPASAIGKEKVVLRITGDGDATLSTNYAFDQEFDGLKYCSHSESGVGNAFVLGTAIVAEDKEAPLVTATTPAKAAENVSATGRITISYNERITAGDVTLKALLQGDGETVELKPEWNNRSLVFNYMGLAYGTTYTLTLPAGYTVDRSGNAAEELTLSFTTMERRQPAAKVYDAIVAQDGSGDYTTVQGAVDAAPSGRGAPWLIFIKNGKYKEHIDVPKSKPYLHFIGQDRDQTIILDDKLCGGENALHVSVGATVVVNADNVFFENLTLENSYGHEKQQGPQALALNTIGDRIALNNVALLSYQDTWITSSNQKARHYIKNSVIEGAVDFIYNGGDVYLDGDTLDINRPSGGYIVAPRHTKASKWGYVFQNNVIRAHKGIDVKDVWLGRPWHDEPKTVFINTKTYVNIPAKGWFNTMGGLPALWAEYNTVDANGVPIDLSQRETYYYWIDKNTGEKHEVEGVKNTLTADEADEYTLKNVMGGTDNWQPNLLCEACDAPQVTAADGWLSWQPVPYAICYIVICNNEVVGFTTETRYPEKEGLCQVRAVNEYGGLSPKASPNQGTRISTTSISTQPACIYTLDGRSTRQLRRGLNIVRHKDGQVIKVIK